MAEHQGPRRHAVCIIKVDGNDITTKLFPFLISVQVIDQIEGGTDECHIELDDRDAQLQIPPDNAKIQVLLGWAGEGPHLYDLGRSSAAGGQGAMQPTAEQRAQEAAWGGPGVQQVFNGWVTKVESGFGRRGGGRRLWIDAEGFDSKQGSKEMQRKSFGEGKKDDSQSDSGGSGGGAGGGAGGAGGGGGQIPLKTVMTEMFSKAGITAKLSPEMAKIAQDYWYVNDSPMNFGMRMARERGGFFKISNNIATLVGKTEGVNADGDQMPTVEAIWGVNLIGWRIKPYTGRPQWGGTQSKYFDLFEGVLKTVDGKVGGATPFGGSNAIAHQIGSVVDKNVAGQVNTGAGKDSEVSRGRGWVLLNGEPNAKSFGHVRIDGARPGVDGTYLITSAEHNYTRGVGYTTRCQVQNPTGTAGGFGWKQTTEGPKPLDSSPDAMAPEAYPQQPEAKPPIDPMNSEAYPPTPNPVPISGPQDTDLQRPTPPISGPQDNEALFGDGGFFNPGPPSPPISQ
jgi:hypothetical protein